eukprot:jgi/Galph1/2725/GphlegSOOS_G1387.1
MAPSRRLLKELEELQRANKEEKDQDIILQPSAENLMHWQARLKGPVDSPYEGGTFQVEIRVPNNYPLSAPSVRFKTKVFHPNIHAKTGDICLDILKTSWSPAWTLQSICRAILVLLSHPEPESPLNCDAGNLLRAGDLRGYRSVAKMFTTLYANP